MEITTATTNILPATATNNNNTSTMPDTEEKVLCPSCNKRLKLPEVAQHCEEEMHALRQLSQQHTQQQQQAVAVAAQSKARPVFQRVQRNRQSRLRQRTRKRPPSTPAAEYPCPVCALNFSKNDIQRHAEQCLQRSNGQHDSSTDDEEAEESFEEYEWCGQKRIRVSTLLPGGYAAAFGRNHNGSTAAPHVDDEEDLNVDEDDTHIFGPSQYNESDIIPTLCAAADDADVTTYMRSLITGNSSSASSSSSNNSDATPTAAAATNVADIASTSNFTTTTNSSSSLQCSQQIIESLKCKLQLQEQQLQGKYKCLICLEDYHKPTISVCCWHVHCEECWLRSLGARKLCPQCNLITTPKDLRRIYL